MDNEDPSRHLARPGHKFYCPRCGEVRYGYKHWLDGWIVQEHHKYAGRWEYEVCPGGRVDQRKDEVH